MKFELRGFRPTGQRLNRVHENNYNEPFEPRSRGSRRHIGQPFTAGSTARPIALSPFQRASHSGFSTTQL